MLNLNLDYKDYKLLTERERMNLSEKIFEAGVVGAGGAGFPTHVKSQSQVEYMIANGAECEPLLHKDFELMVNFPEQVVKGLQLMKNAVGAKKAVIGIKSKNAAAIEAISEAIQEQNAEIEIAELEDYYPAGDEYELVYNVTGRLIPPHGIPLDVGAVVNNVESLYNVALAAEGEAVTEKFIVVTGAVKNPSAFWVPVGTRFSELLEFAGGATVGDFAFFDGGLMMGKLSDDLSKPVTKTSGAVVVLPREHHLVARLSKSFAEMNRIGKSACDQCSYCTEFCPRYLLGYEVQPHKVMRTLGFTHSGDAVWNEYADLCSMCGLCTLYACPEELYPREANIQAKKVLSEQGKRHEQKREVKVHPMKKGRKTPTKRLIKKLDVAKYDVASPFREGFPEPREVKILTKQHVGAPAIPTVTLGAKVNRGDVIARPKEGALGSVIHASINGVVTHVSEEFIRIAKE